MTKTIWKYTIAVTDEQRVAMPFGAEILAVQFQGANACLWVLGNPDNALKNRTIKIHGTGHEFEDYPNRYIGTIQEEGGALVWHVFEALS